MNDSPISILLYCFIALYIGKLYRSDIQAYLKAAPNPKALPGATTCSGFLMIASLMVSAILLGNEVLGEYVLGIVEEQNEMVWFFLFANISAGIIEELVFRGYLVITDKGKTMLIASCVGFSAIFSLIHGYLFDFTDGFKLVLSPKALFTSWILFANSLWFYALRFGPWNPSRSILPSMVAHIGLNLGVFGVKLAQGYITF